jgi:hypothetical protein
VSSEQVEWRFLRFHFKEVMLGCLSISYVIMLLNYSSMLLVVVVSLVML